MDERKKSSMEKDDLKSEKKKDRGRNKTPMKQSE